MKRQNLLLLGFILGGSILLFANALMAWKAITNPPSTWRSLPVPYYVNNSGCADIGGFDPAVEVCEVSWDTWEYNDCTSWQVSYQGGSSASPLDNRDSQWVLGWVESGWPYGGYAIGVTMNVFGSGILWGSDISFNAVNFTWTTFGGGGYQVDSQSIVTHEEGHFLGLDHPSCTMQQTMCASYSGGIAERDLTSDDIEGVCTLYPGTGPPPTCTTSADCDDRYECIDGDCVGQMCARCSVHDDCGGADDYCLSGFADGNLYCGVSCLTDAECGEGNTCFDLGGGLKQCLPSTLDCSGTGPECVVDTDCSPGYICEGGVCVPQPPPECTTDDDCMEGYVCRDNVCVVDDRPNLLPCTQCATDYECGDDDDLCITFYPDGSTFAGGVSYCGNSCNEGCDLGFACYEFPDKPAQCLPESQSCESCDPVFFTTICRDGFYCDFVNCSTGICIPGTPGPKPLGERCSNDLECDSLQCVKQVGGSFCSAVCSFGYGYENCYQLDDRFTCQPRDFGACGYCSCAAGRLGDVCSRDSGCQSGGCFTLPDDSGKVCSMYCGGVITCPSNFDCQYSPQGDWGCFPTILKPGDPCDNEFAQCLGGWCDLAGEGGGYCTRKCGGSCSCPINMHCETNSEGVEICVQGKSSKSGCGCRIVGADPRSPGLVLLWILVNFLSFMVIRRLRKKR